MVQIGWRQANKRRVRRGCYHRTGYAVSGVGTNGANQVDYLRGGKKNAVPLDKIARKIAYHRPFAMVIEV
jgi:hypothetical protein